jgi:hypothetical protein
MITTHTMMLDHRVHELYVCKKDSFHAGNNGYPGEVRKGSGLWTVGKGHLNCNVSGFQRDISFVSFKIQIDNDISNCKSSYTLDMIHSKERH